MSGNEDDASKARHTALGLYLMKDNPTFSKELVAELIEAFQVLTQQHYQPQHQHQPEHQPQVQPDHQGPGLAIAREPQLNRRLAVEINCDCEDVEHDPEDPDMKNLPQAQPLQNNALRFPMAPFGKGSIAPATCFLNLPQGKHVEVVVCAVSSPWDFWVRRADSHASEFRKLSKHMKNFFNSRRGRDMFLSPTDVYIGHYVVVKYADDSCYRVRIESASSRDYQIFAEVLHIDIGTTETVPIRILKPMRLEWTKLPQQAVQVRLPDVSPAAPTGWSAAAAYYMLRFTKPSLGFITKTFAQIHLITSTSPLEVSIYWTTGESDYNLSSELIRLGYAKHPTLENKNGHLKQFKSCNKPVNTLFVKNKDDWTRTKTSSALTKTIPEDCLSGKEKILADVQWGNLVCPKIAIVSALTPENFLMTFMTKDSSSLTAEMTEYYTHGAGIYRRFMLSDLVPHQYCAALIGDEWRRAFITSVKGNIVFVRVVDLEEMQCVALGEVKPLRRIYAALPVQGRRARLHGIRPIGADYTLEACNYFTDMLINPAAIVTLVKARDIGLDFFAVDLTIQNACKVEMNVAQILIDAGHAERHPE